MVFGLLLAVTVCSVSAQTPPNPAPNRAASVPATSLAPLPSVSVTHHTIDLAGRTLHFTATVGALRKLDDAGAPQYDMVLTAYTLDGADYRKRPVTFAFNGGPGTASAFLQLGTLGPWRLPIDGEATAPSAPPVVQPNDDTWLDFTDLVFVDPVGTGFSRFVSQNEELKKRIWSIEGDVDSLGETIRRWIAENGRATSPKFILGESYGGIRGPRLVRELQSGQGIGVDGLILVSPALEIQRGGGAIDALVWATLLPSMTAAAREAHGPVDRASLADVERYAEGDYLHDLLLGTRDAAAIGRIVDRVTDFTGLDRSLVALRAGRIDSTTFVRTIHRGSGEQTSFYDSTVGGPDPFPNSLFSNHPDPITEALRAPLTEAILDLGKHELNWLPADHPYELSNSTTNRQWDFGRNSPEAVSALRTALALDRRMKVLVAHGTTDLVTPYFRTRLMLNQIPATVASDDRLRFEVYPGGHMFYARDASRRAFRDAAEALYPK